MDNSDIKPSTSMLIAGGAVLFLSTLLDWASGNDFGFDGASGWDTDFFGLHGILVAVIGLAIGGGVALNQFGNVSMPDKILGFDHDQLHLALGLAAFCITFGYQFASGDKGIGILLGWLASAVIMAGAIMDLQGSKGDATPPTQF